MFAFAISIYLTIPNLTEKPAFELEAADLLTVRELAMDVKYYLNTSIGGDGLKKCLSLLPRTADIPLTADSITADTITPRKTRTA